MPKKNKLPRYIQKRADRYYAVLEIPKDLRRHYPGKTLGKKLVRLVQSLETDSLAVAKRRVGSVVSGWQSEFARLKDEPDDAGYFRRRLQKAKDERERASVLTQIDTKAENLASPSFSTYPGQPDHQAEAAYKEAEQAAADRAKDFYDRATGVVTGLTDHMEDWLERSDVSDKTKDMRRVEVKQFAERFPTVQDVTHEGVQRWIDSLGVAPATIQRMLGGLRGYWRYLQRPDIKAASKDFQPFTDLELPKATVKAGKKRKEFQTRDVIRLYMVARGKNNDTQLGDLIRLAMWSGCRIEELCSLKIEQVHKGHIDIEDAKTEAGIRQVPIHKALKRDITRMVKDTTDGYVISGLTLNKYGDRSNALGKRFGRLKNELGYGPEFVFHSIRKTVSTLLENAGVPENVAADILGHEKPRITYGLYSGGSSIAVKTKALNSINYGAEKKAA